MNASYQGASASRAHHRFGGGMGPPRRRRAHSNRDPAPRLLGSRPLECSQGSRGPRAVAFTAPTHKSKGKQAPRVNNKSKSRAQAERPVLKQEGASRMDGHTAIRRLRSHPNQPSPTASSGEGFAQSTRSPRCGVFVLYTHTHISTAHTYMCTGRPWRSFNAYCVLYLFTIPLLGSEPV